MESPQGITSADPGAAARVLVVDDHCTFAELVVVALAHEEDLDCVGAAHDADRARRMTRELVPDVILMDVNLGKHDGLDLTAELVAAHPGLRVVVLTAHADSDTMRRAAAAGACALLPKDGSLPDLLNGLRSARPGGFVVHPALLRTLVTEERASEQATGPQPVLTPRELRVLQLLADGRDTRSIAGELKISVNTCRGYVKNVLMKLDAHSQLEAVVIAGRHGLVDAGPRR
jgi:DNA-binding NarL/FixJ family response regulator